MGVTLVATDNVASYIGAIDNPVITKGEKITDIVPLANAISILSNEIGEMSSYTVCSTELAYRGMFLGENNWTVSDNYPVWKFVCRNNTDKKETRFYVNVVTGEIESDVF